MVPGRQDHLFRVEPYGPARSVEGFRKWRQPHPHHATRRNDRDRIARPPLLYYFKGGDAGSSIWRVPVDGGDETPVVGGLSYSLNFVVARRGLFFIAGHIARLPASIEFFDYETGKRTTLHTLGRPPGVGMALSYDEPSLLFATIDRAGTDLMVVERFR
jgi:hypothetical protein